MDELLAALAALIIQHISFAKWLIKIDTECGGRGHAVIDLNKLPFYAEILKERNQIL